MKLRILIIDDEACVRESLAIYLADLGHEVFIAERPGPCHLECPVACSVDTFCVDLLLVDQNMPGESGLDYIRGQIKRGCRLPTSRQVLISGVVTPELEAALAELGCRVLHKPFRLEQLDQVIAEVSKEISSGRLLSPPPTAWGRPFVEGSVP